jgi:hypothetical protein
MRFVTIAGVLGCALFVAIPALPVAAAGTTIYLSIQQQDQGLVSGPVVVTRSTSGQPPAHEYKLENFSQTGANFTATTPLDGSSSAIPNMAGQMIKLLVVRLDGHTIDDAFEFTNCMLKSDKVTANSSSAVLKVSFTCQKESLRVVPPAPPAAATPTPK